MAKALNIGINKYPDPANWLKGCVNDARDWRAFLAGRGFSVAPMLLDSQATKKNILAAMTKLVRSLQPNETGVITFSGHGTWMPDMNGDEPDGRDEALCPYDMDEDTVVLDDEIHNILLDRDLKSRVVLLTDSCHSATVFRFVGRPNVKLRARYLPPTNFVKSGSKLQQISEIEASSRVKEITGIHPTNRSLKNVLHFGGCNDKSYSYDALFNKRFNGAFSYLALQLLRGYSTMPNYSTFFNAVRKKLPNDEYPQTPHFYASAANKKLIAFAST
jgi:hypothetical protein